jgi:hypothetical protein
MVVSVRSDVREISCGSWPSARSKVMTFHAFTRHNSMMTALGESARRVRARYNLTPEERHNLRAAQTPLAVVTASLGGRAHHR